jgi:hypothetical protein
MRLNNHSHRQCEAIPNPPHLSSRALQVKLSKVKTWRRHESNKHSKCQCEAIPNTDTLVCQYLVVSFLLDLRNLFNGGIILSKNKYFIT